jgi:hypothetical protein
MATRIPNSVALARCNAQVDRLDAGTGPGYIEIRTGAQPAAGDDPASGAILVTIPLQDPAFGDAVDLDPGARAAVNGNPNANAAGAGTAGWFRAYDGDDNPVQDGAITVVGGGGEMQIDNPVIAIEATVTISSWNVDELESA